MTSAVLAFERLNARGWKPNTIVDAGAYHGDWSLMASRVFPDASYILIEPIASTELDRVCNEHGWLMAAHALGDTIGEMDINEHGMQTSLLPNAKGEAWGHVREVEVITLDNLLKKVGAASPILLKMDVQGSEMEVLRGASLVLAASDVVQIEVSFIQYAPGVPNAAKIISVLNNAGFILTDWFDMTERSDGQPLQCDIIMMRPYLIDHRWGVKGEVVPWA